MDLASYQRIASDLYLNGLSGRSVAEVRSMRAECQHLEDEVSFVRRVVQGRLDIVRHELDRRNAGAVGSDAAELVASVAHVLTTSRPPMRGSSTILDELTAEANGALDDDAVANLADMSDAGVADALDRLQQLEQLLSVRRRRLFDRLDALSEELTRRYRTGEASVDAVLQ